jgi:hypothetical protein
VSFRFEAQEYTKAAFWNTPRRSTGRGSQKSKIIFITNQFNFIVMKKHFFAVTTAGMLMLGAMTGCNDKPENQPERVPVSLTAGIAPTSTIKVADDQWEATDRVGVYMKKAGQAITAEGAVYADGNNVPMSITDGALTSTPPLYYPLEGSVDFVAYYPYTATVATDQTIAVDLSQQASGLPAEVLYANNIAGQAPSEAAVSLNFNYALAKIALTVTGNQATTLTEADFAGMSVTVDGFYTQASLRLTDGSFVSPQGKQSITLYRAGGADKSATFEALILPATVAADEVTFTFHAGGNSYPCKVTGNYDAATQYDLAFTLNTPAPPQQVAALMSATITPRTVTARSFTVNATPPQVGMYSVEVIPGQLKQQLIDLTGNNLDAVTGLTLTGTADSIDFVTMNALPTLETLNMADMATPDERISNEVFKNNIHLKTLVLPTSCTEIGSDAFWGCRGLTGSLTIPNSVTSIGSGAFWACSGFTGSLTIPNSVTSIGSDAFAYCRGFTGSLTIPNSVTSIESGVFNRCSGFTGSLTIPNSVTSIGFSAFNSCSGFTGSLIIPNSVTKIEGSAFNSCSGFTGSLTLPDRLHEISERAFFKCSGFTGNLNIPGSVRTIWPYAFSGCSGFTGDLTLCCVWFISTNAFADCTGLDGTLTLPTITSFYGVGSGVFSGCINLSGMLVIPDNVTDIQSSAFLGCQSFSWV